MISKEWSNFHFVAVQKQVGRAGSVKGEADEDWNFTDHQDWKGGA